ncbi:AT-rich interactive domain-containing protein 3A [Dunckerocampus dactyliophorus]|uniref:AT-rich interactive domain-containing protein 3A n=1 Tax=Dunckerocampus dactyliophorus TaxID=161453 RepID=UPI002406FB94|nr:AT-rich interactive domain-containing protein 3A [Dunckerocampus dactyliophorus]
MTACVLVMEGSMVDNTLRSVLPAACLSSSSLHPVSAPSHSLFPGVQAQQGGMKLEAVMENLQRQQAARLALEEKLRQEKEKDLRSLVETQIHQQALAFRHYQAAMQSALAAGVSSQPAAGRNRSHHGDHRDMENLEEDLVEDLAEDMEEDEEQDALLAQEARLSARSATVMTARVLPASVVHTRRAESPPGPPQNHEWTYEEQFKQLYELDDDEKRKEFLDDLFSFMQKRGTPVNRIPIMAKQVLDLYMLYKLVTEKGGLVEVINKKIWREITKGLNLPTSITSAAFTLRTQYMKYLYPYECEKRGLSSPGELQAAIDSNRREGRRQSYGSAVFNYSPVGTPTLLSSPKMQLSHLPMPTHNTAHISQMIKKEDAMVASCVPGRMVLPMSPSSHLTPSVAAQAAAAVQAAALEQLRDKLESNEPPEKKMMTVAEEQKRMMQHALQQNLLAMATQLPLSIKLNNRDDRQETALNLSTSGISSINMSIEINGVVYTGVLFAGQGMTAGQRGKHSNCPSQGKTSPMHFHPSCSSSSSSSSSVHTHRTSVSSS